MPETFDHYRTAYHVVREYSNKQRSSSAFAAFGGQSLIVKTNLKAIDFFEGVRTTFYASFSRGMRVDRTTVASYRQMMEEYRWYRLGQPRYRVYPGMVSALAGISIDIDAAHLRLPFPTFTVELPKDYFREHDKAPYLRGLMVHCRRRDGSSKHDQFDYGVSYTNTQENQIVVGPKPPDANDVMIVDMDFGDEVATSPFSKEREICPCKPFAIFDIDGGKTISERFDLMPKLPPIDDGYMPSLEFQKACLRIAVGIAFFAVNDHEVVERYIPGGYREKLERATREGNKKTAQKTNNEIRNAGFAHMFEVGRELVINERTEPGEPREESATGQHLQWGHVRGAHMRWQPHGPRDAPDYKLIFIAPTRVRPDLPLRPGAPHAVK